MIFTIHGGNPPQFPLQGLFDPIHNPSLPVSGERRLREIDPVNPRFFIGGDFMSHLLVIGRITVHPKVLYDRTILRQPEVGIPDSHLASILNPTFTVNRVKPAF